MVFKFKFFIMNRIMGPTPNKLFSQHAHASLDSLLVRCVAALCVATMESSCMDGYVYAKWYPNCIFRETNVLAVWKLFSFSFPIDSSGKSQTNNTDNQINRLAFPLFFFSILELYWVRYLIRWQRRQPRHTM